MKQEISMKELNEYFLETLYRSRLELLSEDDETIDYNIFEEFQSGLTFIYEGVLEKLLEANFINKEIMNLSLELRDKAEEVLHKNDNERLAKFVRVNPKWHEILKLSDKISKLKKDFDNTRD